MKSAYRFEAKEEARGNAKEKRPTMVRVLTKNRKHDMVKASLLPRLISKGFVVAVIE